MLNVINVLKKLSFELTYSDLFVYYCSTVFLD